MTALSEYERLECTGLWRESPEAQRRDVIVSFGDASLVISDMRARALTHWSLAAVERRNPGALPALYHPGAGTGEELELDDETMIAAIARVRAALDRARPRRGRLRLVLLGSALALVIGLMLFWMPGALRRHTVAVVPPSVRAETGLRLLEQIGRAAGRPCTDPAANGALARMASRLLPPGAPAPRVLSAGGPEAMHLPGGLVLLNRAVVEDHEDAAVVAGYILAERARADAADPLDRLLRAAGPVAAFRLLTTGSLPSPVLERYAETLLTRPPAPLRDATLLAYFDAAGVPSTPYAYALDVSGESVLGLIEADPMRGREAVPLLPDADWVRLQGICGG